MGAHERVNWHLCIFYLLDGHLVLVPSLLLLNNFAETWLSIRRTPLWDGQPRTSVLVLESVHTTSSLFHLIQIRFYTYLVSQYIDDISIFSWTLQIQFGRQCVSWGWDLNYLSFPFYHKIGNLCQNVDKVHAIVQFSDCLY